MPPEPFLLHNYDVQTVCLLTLAVVASGFLVSLSRKSRATWWLTAYACAEALHWLVLLFTDVAPGTLWAWVYWGAAVKLALHALPALALVGFAYDFLGRPFPREARVVLGVTLLALLVCTAANALALEGELGFPPELRIAGYVIGAALHLWAAHVHRRRARLAAGDLARRAHRAFAVLMLLGAAMGVVVVLNSLGWGNQWVVVTAYLVARGLYLAGLVALFVSYAEEPTSLQVKVVGFVLASVLVVLALASQLGNGPLELARASGVQLPQREVVRFVPAAGGGYRVEIAEADPAFAGGDRVEGMDGMMSVREVPLGFAFPFAGRTWRSVHINSDGYVTFGRPVRTPDFHRSRVPTIAVFRTAFAGGGVHLARAPGRVSITWRDVQHRATYERATFRLDLDAAGSIALAYADVGAVLGHRWAEVRGVLPEGPAGPALDVEPGATLPAALPAGRGVRQGYRAPFAAYSSGLVTPWLWLVGAVTLAVLLGLPLLLRSGVTRPLARLVDGVRRVETGDLETEVEVQTLDEVGQLTAGFNRMTRSLREADEALRAYAATLEARVTERTAELAANNAELERALAEVRAAQGALEALTEERTRRRLADDIHDGLGSRAGALGLQLEVAARTLELPETARARLQTAAEATRRLAQEVRETVWLVDAGHDTAHALVERLGAAAREVLGALPHDVRREGEAPPVVLPHAYRRNVLLAFREAAHNAARHAGASRVCVVVRTGPDRLAFEVTDDGRGLPEGRPGEGGRGMRTMRERAEALGGRVEASAAPGGGTRVRFEVPLPPAAPAEPPAEAPAERVAR